MCEMDMYFSRENYYKENVENLPFVREILREDNAASDLIKVRIRVNREWENKEEILSLLECFADFMVVWNLPDSKRSQLRDILLRPEFAELAEHKCLEDVRSVRITEDVLSLTEDVSSLSDRF